MKLGGRNWEGGGTRSFRKVDGYDHSTLYKSMGVSKSKYKYLETYDLHSCYSENIIHFNRSTLLKNISTPPPHNGYLLFLIFLAFTHFYRKCN